MQKRPWARSDIHDDHHPATWVRKGRPQHRQEHLRGHQTHCHRGHISLAVAFTGPNGILGLCKCNPSLTVKRELSAAVGRNEVESRIRPMGLAFATCALQRATTDFAPSGGRPNAFHLLRLSLPYIPRLKAHTPHDSTWRRSLGR